MITYRSSPGLIIGFLPLYDVNGPSSRYRVFQFIKPLEQLGYRCCLIPAPQGNPWKRLAYIPHLFWLAIQCDVLFIQKRTLPLWLLKPLKAINSHILYDFDDAIFLQPRQKARLERMLRMSMVVIAGNEYLATYARQYNPRVVVVPTVVDTDRYRPPDGERHSGDSRVILGWIGSDPTCGNLELLLPVLGWLAKKYGECIVMKIVAGRNWLVDCPIPLEFTPWRLETSLMELQRFDIGLAPLADNEWNRGKCGLKLIQYMAVGIPAVASPVGVHVQILEHGRSGFLAGSIQEWQNSLATLIEDNLLRLQMGEEARRRVEAHYSMKSVLPIMENIFHQAFT